MGDPDLERWVLQLASDDPVFAAASSAGAASDRRWQSAVFLLTADPDLWAHFGPTTMTTGTLEAASHEALALYGYEPDRTKRDKVRPSRHWRRVQTDLLVWTSFCWTDQWFDGPTAIPRALPAKLFERWLTALWLQRDHPKQRGLLDT